MLGPGRAERTSFPRGSANCSITWEAKGISSCGWMSCSTRREQRELNELSGLNGFNESQRELPLQVGWSLGAYGHFRAMSGWALGAGGSKFALLYSGARVLVC